MVNELKGMSEEKRIRRRERCGEETEWGARKSE